MADSGSIAQFMDVTGASQEAARFFLESSGGVVDAAVDQFFATGGDFSAVGAPEQEAVEADNVLPIGKLLVRHHALLSQWHSYLKPKNARTMSSSSRFVCKCFCACKATACVVLAIHSRGLM